MKQYFITKTESKPNPDPDNPDRVTCIDLEKFVIGVRLQSLLTSMGIEKFTLPLNYNPRTFIAEHINTYDELICRPNRQNESIVSYLIDQLLNNETTCIFIDNGDSYISGIIIFRIQENMLYVEAICVPGQHKGNGVKLLNYMKELAKELGLPQIKLEYTGESMSFYRKNGFTCGDKYCTFNITNNNDAETTDKTATGVGTADKKATSKKVTSKNKGGSKPTTKKQRKYTR
jgi:hypothetical protein